jgi:hypothetical protein
MKRSIRILILALLVFPWLVSAEDFPVGTFKGIGFSIEKKSFRMTEKDLYKHEASVTIEFLGDNKYSFLIQGKVQKSPSSPAKEDARKDQFIVQWESEYSGKLINIDSKYSGDKSTFEISGDNLTIKSWVSRSQVWETHVYALK